MLRSEAASCRVCSAVASSRTTGRRCTRSPSASSASQPPTPAGSSAVPSSRHPPMMTGGGRRRPARAVGRLSRVLDRSGAYRSGMTESTYHPAATDVEQAVALAVRAPSIHNTQPWRWVFAGNSLQLYADRSRQLAAIDPDGRGLLVSCGGALYLAWLALAAQGWQVEVERLPDPADPDLL